MTTQRRRPSARKPSWTCITAVSRFGRNEFLGDSHGETRVLEHEPELVEEEFRSEVEGGRRVVVAGLPAVAVQTRVALLEPFHGEPRRTHPGGRSIGSLAYAQCQAVHGEGVREGRCFEIDVLTAVELRRGTAVDQPAARRVSLEPDFGRALPGLANDVSAACRPARVERDGVADAPRVAVLDRR